MNKKETISFSINIILFFTTCLIFLLCDDLKLGLCLLFGSNALARLISFIFNYHDKKYENIISFCSSLGALISSLYIILIPKNIVLIFLIWLGINSIIKLKKADRYHDKKDKMWLFSIFNLFIFITIGIIISLSINYPSDIIIKFICLFFIINSIMDLLDSFVLYLKRG